MSESIWTQDLLCLFKWSSLDFWLLANLDLSISSFVLILLWCRLQVHVTLPVEHDLCDLLVKLVKWILEALLQFVSDKVRLGGPSLETLGDQVVGETFKLLVGLLHLIVLGVEQD